MRRLAILALGGIIVLGGVASADLEKPACKPSQIDSVALGQRCARYHRETIADLKAEIRKLRND